MRTIHWSGTFLLIVVCSAGCNASPQVVTDIHDVTLSGTCPDLVHDGDLEIYPEEVEIESLAAITEITGSLVVASFEGETHDGFPCLRTVGGSVALFDSGWLEVLSGFPALTRIGDTLWIERLQDLTHLDAFGALAEIGGSLVIFDMDRLETLSAFGSLEVLPGNLEIGDSGGVNARLVSLAGLDEVRTLGGDLLVWRSMARPL